MDFYSSPKAFDASPKIYYNASIFIPVSNFSRSMYFITGRYSSLKQFF
jgi:hypothetical protein